MYEFSKNKNVEFTKFFILRIFFFESGLNSSLRMLVNTRLTLYVLCFVASSEAEEPKVFASGQERFQETLRQVLLAHTEGILMGELLAEFKVGPWVQAKTLKCVVLLINFMFCVRVRRDQNIGSDRLCASDPICSAG